MMNFNSNKMHQILDIDQSFVIETPLMNLSFYNNTNILLFNLEKMNGATNYFQFFLIAWTNGLLIPKTGVGK